MRKKIVAGNWKMNLKPSEGEMLVKDVLKEKHELAYNHNVIFCVPFTHLSDISRILGEEDRKNIYLGAQNCSDKESGAYTGEISTTMLNDLGVRFVITGHSERREIYGETNELVKNKVDAIIKAKMIPIFCCGEPLDIRNRNEQNIFVEKQIEDSLYHLNNTAISNLVIAYEPIWAIGTGKTATPDQAEEMHAFIRNLIDKKWGSEVAENMTILYGGSVKEENAVELFNKENIDGGLIGGASLDADSFLGIIKAMS